MSTTSRVTIFPTAIAPSASTDSKASLVLLGKPWKIYANMKQANTVKRRRRRKTSIKDQHQLRKMTNFQSCSRLKILSALVLLLSGSESSSLTYEDNGGAWSKDEKSHILNNQRHHYSYQFCLSKCKCLMLFRVHIHRIVISVLIRCCFAPSTMKLSFSSSSSSYKNSPNDIALKADVPLMFRCRELNVYRFIKKNYLVASQMRERKEKKKKPSDEKVHRKE